MKLCLIFSLFGLLSVVRNDEIPDQKGKLGSPVSILLEEIFESDISNYESKPAVEGDTVMQSCSSFTVSHGVRCVPFEVCDEQGS